MRQKSCPFHRWLHGYKKSLKPLKMLATFRIRVSHHPPPFLLEISKNHRVAKLRPQARRRISGETTPIPATGANASCRTEASLNRDLFINVETPAQMLEAQPNIEAEVAWDRATTNKAEIAGRGSFVRTQKPRQKPWCIDGSAV